MSPQKNFKRDLLEDAWQNFCPKDAKNKLINGQYKKLKSYLGRWNKTL